MHEQLAESSERVKAAGGRRYDTVEPAADDPDRRYCIYTTYRRSAHPRAVWRKHPRAGAWGPYDDCMETAIRNNYDEVRLQTMMVDGKKLIDVLGEHETM